MARQKGIIKLEGSIGDVSFYKSKDGYLAREKGGVDADRIKNDPAFQRTRENGSEFGRAGKAGRVLRNAFRLMLQNSADSRVTSRLTKEMVRVVKSDTTHPRGERTASDGEIGFLEGFDFNIDSKLSSTMYADYTPSIDRVAGELGVSIDAMVPGNSIVFPSGATHVKIQAGAAEIDFENETFNFGLAESAPILLGSQVQAAQDLIVSLNENSTQDLFVVFGLDFLQEVNGSMYPLKSGGFNPLSLVMVEKLPNP
ncbi:MAG: hypothetical protein OCD76_03070 [Reichenbachiella sp.]